MFLNTVACIKSLRFLFNTGISYNPSFKDHQNLLKKVADDEIKQIKEEEHLDRVTTKLFSKLTREEENVSFFHSCGENLV